MRHKDGLYVAPDACNWLALHIDEGGCTHCDQNHRVRPLNLLRTAALLGHEIAQVTLGVVLKGVDTTESREWFKLAATAGNAQAQYETGKSMIASDLASALRWISIAAGNGDACALAFLQKGTYC